jgi:hypothetical protein
VHHLHDPYVIDHPEGAYVFLGFGKKQMLPPPSPLLDESLVFVQGCGEIKCPAAKVKMFYSENPKHAIYGFPVYYFDQIQGAMAINSWPWCDVVVYNPTRTQVTRFYRDQVYWEKTLFPKLHHFYFNLFLPLVQRRINNTLQHHSILPIVQPIRLMLKTPAVSRHPIIEDVLEWFARKPIHCFFVEEKM